jgi:ribosomal-protein-alanine N-acetyltransferase
MMEASALETERLMLRPPSEDDVTALYAFMGDPRAMAFTHIQRSVSELRHYLAVHEAQRERVGCAPWVVTEKAGGRVVGFGGLYEDPFDPGWGVEVAYFFHPAAWGRGYATELTQFCVAEARRLARWPRLVAFTHSQNAASHRALLRAGFAEERFVSEMNRRLYGISLGA